MKTILFNTLCVMWLIMIIAAIPLVFLAIWGGGFWWKVFATDIIAIIVLILPLAALNPDGIK